MITSTGCLQSLCQTFLTWSRGIIWMSGILILSYRLKEVKIFLWLTLFRSFKKLCISLQPDIRLRCNLGSKCSILNGQVIYIEKSNWILMTANSFHLMDPFRILRTTSVSLGKGTKFALHHGKMSTTKRRAIQILHISTFQFTFKCGYNDFISKYTDINSLHVTQINLLHNNTCCST